MTPEV